MGRFFAGDIHSVLNGFVFNSNVVAWNFHGFDHSTRLGEYRSVSPAQAGTGVPSNNLSASVAKT